MQQYVTYIYIYYIILGKPVGSNHVAIVILHVHVYVHVYVHVGIIYIYNSVILA